MAKFKGTQITVDMLRKRLKATAPPGFWELSEMEKSTTSIDYFSLWLLTHRPNVTLWMTPDGEEYFEGIRLKSSAQRR